MAKPHFSSSEEGDFYVDLPRVTLHATSAPLVRGVILKRAKDLEYDAVRGLTLGAEPIETRMIHVTTQSGQEIDAYGVGKVQIANGPQRCI